MTNKHPSQQKILSTADLPSPIRVLTDAYRVSKADPDAVIKEENKSKVIVLVTESVRNEDVSVTIVVSHAEKTKLAKTLRALIVRFRKQYEKVLVADCYDDSIMTNILVEHDKRGKTNNMEMDEKDKERLNDVLDILNAAMNYKASDIHVEVEGGKCLIKFRINTELVLHRPELPEFGIQFARICYTIFPTLGDEDGTAPGTYNHNEIMEGDFTISTKDHKVKARMLNLPHNHGDGFDFILRLIDKAKKVEAKPITKLGFSVSVSTSLQKVRRSNAGLFLIAGITGSGKSTTQQNEILVEVKNSGGKRKIITVEQPVEYPLPGVTQISGQDPLEGTKDSQNFSFDNVNRYFLRADPDSLGYGEIRDERSAFAAYKGVESGHKVYATTHTRSAISCFPRLKSFGLTTEQIAKEGFIAGILYQHLLPKVCPHCSIKYEKGRPIPPSFDENFVLNAHSVTNPALDFNTIKAASLAVGKNGSIIRHLQNRGILRTADAVEMLYELDSLNDFKQELQFQDRLDTLIDHQHHSVESSNIRFRGKGCDKCFNGTIGVVPVAEAIIPDADFLSLIEQDSITEAQNYWRTMLGGKTSIEDAYSKIFDGIVDPRSAELKLSKELNSH